VLDHRAALFLKHRVRFGVKAKRPLAKRQFPVFVISKQFHIVFPVLK
jgi:hypothetical protein